MIPKIITVIACLAGSISAQTTDEKIALLEARVKSLEDQAKKPIAQPPPTRAGATSGKLSLEKWSHSFSVTKYEEPGYNLGIRITNGYGKAIKLIDGFCVYKDALGEMVFSATLEKDVKIAPGASLEVGGFYTFNRFENERFRMRDMGKDDITARLLIRKIVFSDNSILDIEKEATGR